MRKVKNAYTVLVGKLKGKEARPRHRWKNTTTN
jgi:hypothetical protein